MGREKGFVDECTNMDGLRKFASAVVRTVKPAVTRNMLVTNTATSAVLFTSGDVIQQRIEKSMGQKNRYDFTRSGRMFLVGLSQGPPHHFWYIYLDKWLPKKTLRTVVLKILADQFIAAPFFRHHLPLWHGDSRRQEALRVLERVRQKVPGRLHV